MKNVKPLEKKYIKDGKMKSQVVGVVMISLVVILLICVKALITIYNHDFRGVGSEVIKLCNSEDQVSQFILHYSFPYPNNEQVFCDKREISNPAGGYYGVHCDTYENKHLAESYWFDCDDPRIN